MHSWNYFEFTEKYVSFVENKQTSMVKVNKNSRSISIICKVKSKRNVHTKIVQYTMTSTFCTKHVKNRAYTCPGPIPVPGKFFFSRPVPSRIFFKRHSGSRPSRMVRQQNLNYQKLKQSTDFFCIVTFLLPSMSLISTSFLFGINIC